MYMCKIAMTRRISFLSFSIDEGTGKQRKQEDKKLTEMNH